MPVILDPGDFELWLDFRQKDLNKLRSLVRPAAAGLLTLYPVSQTVNKVANQGPECVAPVSES